MPAQTIAAKPESGFAVSSALDVISETLGQVAAFLPKPGRSVACGKEALRLLQLTDEELAKLGLTRDDVVSYAYRDL